VSFDLTYLINLSKGGPSILKNSVIRPGDVLREFGMFRARLVMLFSRGGVKGSVIFVSKLMDVAHATDPRTTGHWSHIGYGAEN
jgi:hypothetical protein